MISIVEAKYWEKYSEYFVKDPDITIMDLRDCTKKPDYLHKFTEIFSDDDGVKIDNLDDLTLLIEEFFLKNWLEKINIYIAGWKGVIERHPLFGQQLLQAIYNARLNAIAKIEEDVFHGHKSAEETDIIEALQFKVGIELYLN